jgi:hypothetical protein
MTGANVTNNPEHLVFGKTWIEGTCRAKLIQRLHVEVTNSGQEDYQGFWKVIDSTGDTCNSYDIEMTEVPAGETKDVTIMLYFNKPGSYEMSVMSVNPEKKLFDYEQVIAEFEEPKVTGSIQVDMLEKTDKGNVVYGDFAHFRITGTVTVTNEEDVTIFAHSYYDGIQLYFRPWFGYKYFYVDKVCNLGYELKGGETVTKEFVYDFLDDPVADMEYYIYLHFVCGYSKTIVEIPFTVKQGTNTYWTVDGHVKPLPVESGQVLKVPGEAMAVDMRGLYGMDTIFSIDTSDANPNCLYYLGFLDNVPQGFSSEANVIRDEVAKNLIVDADHDYYCPMPFKAKSALFKYTPVSESQGPAKPNMTQMMSGALVLPFDVSQVSLNDMNGASGGEDGYDGDDLKVCRFIRDEEHVLYFQPVTEHQLNAYEPYLLYVKPSALSFFAEDVTISRSRQAIAQGNEYDFIGSTVAVAPSHGLWKWNCDNNYFYWYFDISTGGGQARSNNAFIDWKDSDEHKLNASTLHVSLPVVLLDAGDTKVSELRMDSREKSKAVYSLSGQRVGTAEMKEKGMTVQGLRPGLYIIGGRKVVVR